MRVYTLYTYEKNEFVGTYKRLKELCEKLDRSKSSVEGTIWRIEKGKLKRIRDYEGNFYRIEIKKEGR